MRVLFASTVALGLFSFSAAAAGDNPDVAACRDKQEGDACMRIIPTKTADGPLEERRVPGVCAPDECCDLDYSKGSPPETKCGPCLACKPGAGTPPVAGDEAGADDDTTPPVASPPADDGGQPPPTTTAEGKKGCSVGAPGPGLAWALPLLLVLMRRRD